MRYTSSWCDAIGKTMLALGTPEPEAFARQVATQVYPYTKAPQTRCTNDIMKAYNKAKENETTNSTD